MAEDQTMRGRGPAAHHMLITAANVGANDLKNDAVFTLSGTEREFREVNGLDFDFTRTEINDATIGCHQISFPRF